MAEDRWLHVKDIVDLLGVHEQTVRKWIKHEGLPAVMFGRRSGYRVRASDLAAFLEARRVDAGDSAGKDLAA